MDSFIEAIWGERNGFIEIRAFSDTGEVKKPVQKWTTPDKLKGQMEALSEWGARKRLGIFAGVLPRKTEGGGSARDTSKARVVWCDLDFKDYDGGEAEARHQLARFHEPSIVVASGNGLHGYWLLDRFYLPEDLSTANRQIAAYLGGDMSATDPARVLRLPGTFNAKAKELKAVEIESLNASRRYDLDELTDGLPTPRARIDADTLDSVEIEELSPAVASLLETAPLCDLLRGKGKPGEGPNGQPLGTDKSGYDWSLLKELVWQGVDDPGQLGAVLALKIRMDEKAAGKPSSRGSRYVTRTVRRLLSTNPKKRTAPPAKAPQVATDTGGPAPKKQAATSKKKRPKPRGDSEAAVWAELEMGNVRPMACSGNLHKILTMDSRQKGRLWWDTFRDRPCYGDTVLTDVEETKLLLWIEATYGVIGIGKPRLREIIDTVAFENKKHVVREYLDGLEWDGIPRLDTWLSAYLGGHLNDRGQDIDEEAEEELLAAMGRKFMVSAVARAFNPGCKVDTMLILVGPQGCGKSTAFRILAGADWFSDSDIDLRSKDKYQVLAGNWLYEIAELDSFRKADQQQIKAFITSQVDKFRPTHGHRTVERPRQCVFVGTTNESEFLSDKTGSRRFWLVEVEGLDLKELAKDRDQLWAEAVTWYTGGEAWFLSRDLEARRAQSAEVYARSDAWADALADYVEDKASKLAEANRWFTIADALNTALDIELGKMNKLHTMRASGILQKLGCTKKRRRDPSGKQKMFYCPAVVE